MLKVCFSADHGVFSWNPILILGTGGLACLRKRDRIVSLYSIIVVMVFLYVIGCYPDWDGISSFGNRFFVPLTSLFIIGLAAFFDWFARAWQERRAAISAATATCIIMLWNLGLMFQWGMHLVPERGPISWRDAAYNQVNVVPEEAATMLKAYLTGRGALMERIEQRDVQELKRSLGAK